MSLNSQQIVVPNDDFQEFLFEVVVGRSEARMHRVVELESVCVLIANANVAVLDDS